MTPHDSEAVVAQRTEDYKQAMSSMLERISRSHGLVRRAEHISESLLSSLRTTRLRITGAEDAPRCSDVAGVVSSMLEASQRAIDDAASPRLRSERRMHRPTLEGGNLGDSPPSERNVVAHEVKSSSSPRRSALKTSAPSSTLLVTRSARHPQNDKIKSSGDANPKKNRDPVDAPLPAGQPPRGDAEHTTLQAPATSVAVMLPDGYVEGYFDGDPNDDPEDADVFDDAQPSDETAPMVGGSHSKTSSSYASSAVKLALKESRWIAELMAGERDFTLNGYRNGSRPTLASHRDLNAATGSPTDRGAAAGGMCRVSRWIGPPASEDQDNDFTTTRIVTTRGVPATLAGAPPPRSSSPATTFTGITVTAAVACQTSALFSTEGLERDVVRLIVSAWRAVERRLDDAEQKVYATCAKLIEENEAVKVWARRTATAIEKQLQAKRVTLPRLPRFLELERSLAEDRRLDDIELHHFQRQTKRVETKLMDAHCRLDANRALLTKDAINAHKGCADVAVATVNPAMRSVLSQTNAVQQDDLARLAKELHAEVEGVIANVQSYSNMLWGWQCGTRASAGTGDALTESAVKSVACSVNLSASMRSAMAVQPVTQREVADMMRSDIKQLLLLADSVKKNPLAYDVGKRPALFDARCGLDASAGVPRDADIMTDPVVVRRMSLKLYPVETQCDAVLCVDKGVGEHSDDSPLPPPPAPDETPAKPSSKPIAQEVHPVLPSRQTSTATTQTDVSSTSSDARDGHAAKNVVTATKDAACGDGQPWIAALIMLGEAERDLRCEIEIACWTELCDIARPFNQSSRRVTPAMSTTSSRDASAEIRPVNVDAGVDAPDSMDAMRPTEFQNSIPPPSASSNPPPVERPVLEAVAVSRVGVLCSADVAIDAGQFVTEMPSASPPLHAASSALPTPLEPPSVSATRGTTPDKTVAVSQGTSRLPDVQEVGPSLEELIARLSEAEVLGRELWILNERLEIRSVFTRALERFPSEPHGADRQPQKAVNDAVQHPDQGFAVVFRKDGTTQSIGGNDILQVIDDVWPLNVVNEWIEFAVQHSLSWLDATLALVREEAGHTDIRSAVIQSPALMKPPPPGDRGAAPSAMGMHVAVSARPDTVSAGTSPGGFPLQPTKQLENEEVVRSEKISQHQVSTKKPATQHVATNIPDRCGADDDDDADFLVDRAMNAPEVPVTHQHFAQQHGHDTVLRMADFSAQARPSHADVRIQCNYQVGQRTRATEMSAEDWQQARERALAIVHQGVQVCCDANVVANVPPAAAGDGGDGGVDEGTQVAFGCERCERRGLLPRGGGVGPSASVFGASSLPSMSPPPLPLSLGGSGDPSRQDLLSSGYARTGGLGMTSRSTVSCFSKEGSSDAGQAGGFDELDSDGGGRATSTIPDPITMAQLASRLSHGEWVVVAAAPPSSAGAGSSLERVVVLSSGGGTRAPDLREDKSTNHKATRNDDDESSAHHAVSSDHSDPTSTRHWHQSSLPTIVDVGAPRHAAVSPPATGSSSAGGHSSSSRPHRSLFNLTGTAAGLKKQLTDEDTALLLGQQQVTSTAGAPASQADLVLPPSVERSVPPASATPSLLEFKNEARDVLRLLQQRRAFLVGQDDDAASPGQLPTPETLPQVSTPVESRETSESGPQSLGDVAPVPTEEVRSFGQRIVVGRRDSHGSVAAPVVGAASSDLPPSGTEADFILIRAQAALQSASDDALWLPPVRAPPPAQRIAIGMLRALPHGRVLKQPRSKQVGALGPHTRRFSSPLSPDPVSKGPVRRVVSTTTSATLSAQTPPDEGARKRDARDVTVREEGFVDDADSCDDGDAIDPTLAARAAAEEAMAKLHATSVGGDFVHRVANDHRRLLASEQRQLSPSRNATDVTDEESSPLFSGTSGHLVGQGRSIDRLLLPRLSPVVSAASPQLAEARMPTSYDLPQQAASAVLVDGSFDKWKDSAPQSNLFGDWKHGAWTRSAYATDNLKPEIAGRIKTKQFNMQLSSKAGQPTASATPPVPLSVPHVVAGVTPLPMVGAIKGSAHPVLSAAAAASPSDDVVRWRGGGVGGSLSIVMRSQHHAKLTTPENDVTATRNRTQAVTYSNIPL